jgi:hypothetical protein
MIQEGVAVDLFAEMHDQAGPAAWYSALDGPAEVTVSYSQEVCMYSLAFAPQRGCCQRFAIAIIELACTDHDPESVINRALASANERRRGRRRLEHNVEWIS